MADLLEWLALSWGRLMANGRMNLLRRAWVRLVLPHLWELALVGGAYLVYMYARSLVLSDFVSTALANANIIISLERELGFFWEPEWQAWALSSAKHMVIFFNWVYIVTFWPVLIITGVILYVVNRQRYLYYRNIVLLSFIFALLGFTLFPLAPPRMIADHFVDTIKAFGPAFYASRAMASFYNPYAAMPSLHFSWTLMFGVLFLRMPNKWIKVMGVLYPTMTLLAITITANHYIMDAMAGALLVIAAFLTMELGFRRRFFLPTILAHLGMESWARRVRFLNQPSEPSKDARDSRSVIRRLATGSRLLSFGRTQDNITGETGSSTQ